MNHRRSEFDVTNHINTTDPLVVSGEVRRIFIDLYDDALADRIDRFFADAARLYRGQYPGYLACDTWYHDLQHVMDVTLAMARLMDGYERSWITSRPPLGEEMFLVGVVCGLLHDCGYIRRHGDTRHANGAEYTLHHISRGSKFLRDYLPAMGMKEWAPIASQVIHFTGYEIPVDRIRLRDPQFRMLGYMLGSADIIAQMSDRCYLEKCRDRLYPEFVLGGVARRRTDDGGEIVMYESARDLVVKTPMYCRGALRRLEEQLGGMYRYAAAHFGGQNLYLEEVNRNMRFADQVSAVGDLSLLRRRPPANFASELFPPGLQ
ncbi:MAG TPA: HD domain-containing protein [Burkholderiales bacterium]|nr:HD domain-containing protein [Burkholderiales bacterium]